jgi:exonuclease SbcC
LEDAFAAARKCADDATLALTRAQSELASTADVAASAAAVYDQLRLEFSDKCRAAGFDSHAAFKEARLTDAQIEALDCEIRDYHVACQAASARLDRARAAADDLPTPDLPRLQAADSAAQQALEGKLAQIEQLTHQLSSCDVALARLNELRTTLDALDARYKVIGALADVANGDNDYRISFQRFVLGVFLDEVLHAATQRLATMSKGRFKLERVTEAGSGRAQRGLDLQVHDTHTSTARPVSTLSGGESFLASLSLALGLADVVQSYAGGIRLETIFVDEGFGTLDPESLELAIRALRDLQKGGRLVGIISHVTELREWIDARLEVTSGRTGSVARFVVG